MAKVAGRTFWRRRISAANWTPSRQLLGRMIASTSPRILEADNLSEAEHKSLMAFRSNNKASISLLQHNLGISYRRATQIIESLQEKGLVSEPDKRGRRNLIVRSVHKKETIFPSEQIEKLDESKKQDFNVFGLTQVHEGISNADFVNRLASLARTGFGRLNEAFLRMSSIREPRFHLLIVTLAALLFALGQFWGGSAVLAYGAMLFMAGEQ